MDDAARGGGAPRAAVVLVALAGAKDDVVVFLRRARIDGRVGRSRRDEQRRMCGRFHLVHPAVGLENRHDATGQRKNRCVDVMNMEVPALTRRQFTESH